MARTVLVGVGAAPGSGVGRVLLVADRPAGEPVADRPAGEAVAGPGRGARRDGVDEASRLREAMEATAAELEALAARIAPVVSPEVAAIFEAQAMMARDPALIEPASAAAASGVPAERAVLTVATTLAEKLAAVDDPYLQARAHDILDVGRRIAGRLAGRPFTERWHADSGPAVLVAEDLAPSETAMLQSDRVAGLALAGGTSQGHAAIVARALGLPLVTGLGEAVLGLAPGSVVAVDGSGGRVILDPGTGELRALGIAEPGTEGS